MDPKEPVLAHKNQNTDSWLFGAKSHLQSRNRKNCYFAIVSHFYEPEKVKRCLKCESKVSMFDNIQPVTISPRAAEEIRKIMQTKNIPAGYGLRVGVKGGGCGVSLLIGFDKQKEADLAYIISDIPVYIDKRHTMYVIGKEVDFFEGEDARGFMFVDPKEPVKND